MKPSGKAFCVLLALTSLAASAQERLLHILPLQGQQVVYDTVLHTSTDARKLLEKAQKFMGDNYYDGVDVRDRSGGSEIRGSGSFYVGWVKSSVQSTAVQVFYTMDVSVKDSAFMIRLLLNKVGMVGKDPPTEMSVLNFAVQRKSKTALEEMDDASLRLISRFIKMMEP